jgi:hypothetical protein|tara:strand:- start:249 stop:404 length:156 start_codon:yes stop_codon:yes gene_type:complete
MLMEKILNVKVTVEELLIIRQALLSTCSHDPRKAEVIQRLFARVETTLEGE